jgi:hypothetical protein
MARQLEPLGAAIPNPEPKEDAGRVWVAAAGIRSVRKRLKI